MFVALRLKDHLDLGILILAFLFTGCAEPKYVIDTYLADEGTSAHQSKESCQVSFLKSGLCLAWYWETRPTATEVGSLFFKTYRLNLFDQTPVEVDLSSHPQVVLWMPSMGHGSIPTQTMRVDEGTYLTTNVFFVMPGEWEIRFQLKYGTEIVDEAQISLVF